MSKTRLAHKDFLTGLFFVLIAVVFAATASTLQMGTFGRMGPGYFPVILAILLGLLGLLLILRTFLAHAASADDRSDSVLHQPPLRALVFILGAALAFAATVKPLGFVPATVIALLLSIAASKRHGVVGGLVLTAALTAGAWGVFIVGLGLPWPLLGTWFR